MPDMLQNDESRSSVVAPWPGTMKFKVLFQHVHAYQWLMLRTWLKKHAILVHGMLWLTASATIITLDTHDQFMQMSRTGLTTLVYPMELAAVFPSHTYHKLRQNLRSHSQLAGVNHTLRKKLLLFRVELQKLTALENENERLRALLNAQQRIDPKAMLAEMVEIHIKQNSHKLLLNRGIIHHAYVGQPLIDHRGIVGQITRVSTVSSTAVLITHSRHILPVMNARTQERYLLSGTGSRERLSIDYLPQHTDIKKGDLLISSGIGSRFPPGIPAARVLSVELGEGQPYLNIEATPVAQLDHGRELLLIHRTEDEQPASWLTRIKRP